ncbi:MAG: c-type cytochrome [Planctomycetes bacterium]|nr:c-type cytochrome [Planctomycetota bacterium]
MIDFLRANNNEDRMLQHAGIMALTWLEDLEGIRKAGKDPSPAVRMAALVALRKLKRPEVAAFLADQDPKLVLEAARAIYDTPIPDSFPALVALLDKLETPERALIRAVNAAFRLGNADALVDFAAKNQGPSSARIEALAVLREWEHPSGRDRLMGLWRPIPDRPKEEAATAFRSRMTALLQAHSEEVVIEAARLAAALKVEGAGAILRKTFEDVKAEGAARAMALDALGELGDPGFADCVDAALRDGRSWVLEVAVRWVPRTNKAYGPYLSAFVTHESFLPVRRAALASMAALGQDEALGKFLDDGLPPELQLDLVEAASKRPALREKAAKLQPSLLEGGDANAGRRIFFERSDVQCVRCHLVGNEGGQVGPPLTKIAEQKTREYLLESIVTPNKQIAEGWGQTAFQMQNDSVEVGRIEKETDATVTLILSDGARKQLAKGDIKARKASLSSMPEDIAKQLSKRDLRDLVAYLAGLK